MKRVLDLSFPCLESLLPPGQTLAGNEQTRLLSLLASSREQRPQLVAQEHLTRKEWCVFMALIDVYPGYAPYAHLLALLTSSDEHMWKLRLREARTHGNTAIKHVLRPLREVLAGIHPKLKRTGLMVASVQSLGYLLAAFDESVSR